MAKHISYPRCSLKIGLQLAKAVDELGGNCSVESAADRLEKKVSGAFHANIGGAVKYGLLNSKNSQLSTTPLYRDYKLAYNPEESKSILSKAFLSVPLFSEITNRFSGIKLPITHFEKLLVREFEVPENMASRVAKYFIEGAKQVGLLNSNNEVSNGGADNLEIEAITESDTPNIAESALKMPESSYESNPNHPETNKESGFSVHIVGPGINSNIAICEEEDLDIVETMLKKVKKKLADKIQP